MGEQKVKKDKHFELSDPNALKGSILFGWNFDCSCGASGKCYDDGKRSLQCDVCKNWMHSKCNGVPRHYDDLMDFFNRRLVWVCGGCRKGDGLKVERKNSLIRFGEATSTPPKRS